MITYRKGDLLDAFEKGEVNLIAHGVNCVGGFGSGIAGQIAKRYPIVREAYLNKFNTTGWELGDTQRITYPDKIIRNDVGIATEVTAKHIANCATQQDCGYDGKCYVDYESIIVCMMELKKFQDETNCVIGIPKIGAGLAGGDWNKIEGIINGIFTDAEIFVYVLEEIN